MPSKNRKLRVLSVGWIITIAALFLYSFTQIDLGLTLTRISAWQKIQKNFQYIGYFNRPLSTYFYLTIIFLLYFLYFLFVSAARKEEVPKKQIWFLIFLTAIILWFSYNAFSHDLFNYIFDARIITFYHENPYEHKALDYPDDPMLGFMHWTHRLYPYGPLWLAASIPLSFLGFQKLIPAMLLFKGLAVVSYLLACWFIEKILESEKPGKSLLGLTIFAFNPLVVVESLVSAHNDILMMMLALAGFWFLVERKYLPAWLMLGLSVGIKFATALFLPIFALVNFWQAQSKKINWEKVMFLAFLLMIAAVLAAVKRDELKPWYLLYPLPFLAFLPAKNWLFWPMMGLSLGALFHYAPFLYQGNWNPPVPAIKFWLTVGFLSLGFLLAAGTGYFKSRRVVIK